MTAVGATASTTRICNRSGEETLPLSSATTSCTTWVPSANGLPASNGKVWTGSLVTATAPPSSVHRYSTIAPPMSNDRAPDTPRSRPNTTRPGPEMTAVGAVVSVTRNCADAGVD